ncbi:hypothetical protein E3A20_30260, partial [Planctomyces bekefii]
SRGQRVLVGSAGGGDWSLF